MEALAYLELGEVECEQVAACLEPKNGVLVDFQARGDEVHVRRHGSYVCALVSRQATTAQYQLERRVQCQPPSASLPPTARLQRETFCLGLVPKLLSAIMAQLLKCLVVQHGTSSFPVSWGVRVDSGSRAERVRYSQIGLPFRIELRMDKRDALRRALPVPARERAG